MKAETSGLRPKAETRWLRLKAKKGGVRVRRNWDLITGQERRSSSEEKLGPNFRASGWRFLVLILEVHGFGSYKKKF